jgi:hypothetical protein
VDEDCVSLNIDVREPFQCGEGGGVGAFGRGRERDVCIGKRLLQFSDGGRRQASLLYLNFSQPGHSLQDRNHGVGDAGPIQIEADQGAEIGEIGHASIGRRGICHIDLLQLAE